MVEAILAVLLSFSPYFEDAESPAERAARMRAVAADIDRAARHQRYFEPVVAAAIILRIGAEETHFAQYVGEGRCREGRYKCDPGKDGNPQSLTYYQLKARGCPKVHTLRDGSPEQHRAAARCAVRLFASAYYRCTQTFAGGFSGYHDARCSWEPAKGRAYRLGFTIERLRAEMARAR